MGLFNRTKAPETEATANPPASTEPGKSAAPQREAVPPPTAPASSALPSPTASPAPPAPAPAPAPAGDPAAQQLLRDLAVKIGQLAGTAESERDAVKKFTNRVEKMEDRLEMFQILFESLSLKYNPFLGKEEADAFEGQTLLPDHPGGGNGGGQAAEAVSETAPAPPTHATGRPHTHNGDGYAPQEIRAKPGSEIVAVRSPATPHPPAPPAPPAPAAPIARPAPTPIHVNAPPATAPRPVLYQPASPWGEPHVRGARESYLALCWFEHLYKSVEPHMALRFLDHYLELGWLTPQAYEWLRHLAISVSPPPESATIAEPVQPKKLTPLQVVRLHKSSLRFFDHVFRFSMDAGETRRLEQAVHGLVERG